MPKLTKKRRPPQGPLGLTERQFEVLELLAQHKRRKEISFELGVSDHTVRAHVDAIRNRLQVTSVTDAVRRYMDFLGASDTPRNNQYIISGIESSPVLVSDQHTEPLEEQCGTAQTVNPDEYFNSSTELPQRESISLDPFTIARPSAMHSTRSAVDTMPLPQFAIAISLTTVGLIILTALCVLILIGVFQAVQSFSGQTG